MAGSRRSRKRGVGRVLSRALRLGLLLLGAWLLFEAWRFPRIARLATEAPARTSFQDYRRAEARRAGKPYQVVQTWVDLGRISRHLRRAVLAAEDDRFYEHEGFDTEEIRDALEDHFERGERLRGASTVSQQLAKNLWLGPERSLLRKGREAVYTWALERKLSKDRILELYLNVVEWGPGVFGAEAAARRYFGISAAALDPRQAALLAAALPAPLKRDPGRPSRGLDRRARMILGRMRRSEPLPRPSATPSPAAPAASPTPTGASPIEVLAAPEDLLAPGRRGDTP